MLLAVLEKRVGIRVGTFDVFVNAVGGVRIDETAADIGIAMAIASSLKNQVINPDVVMIGEIGLGGEIRPVPQIERRIGEAEKLGFKEMVVPKSNMKSIKKNNQINVRPVERLSETVAILMN